LKKKILIYSDCFTYSGSENIIENILHSDLINEQFDIKFYYAYNKQYDEKVKLRLAQFYDDKIFSLNILSETDVRNKMNQKRQNFICYCVYFCAFIFLYLIRLSGIFSFINFFIFVKLLKKEKPTILFINNGGYPGALSSRIAAIAGKCANIKKTIFVVNNMAYPSRNFLEKLLDKQVEKSVDYFVTASHAAKKELIKVRHFPSDKCVNIPNTLYNEAILRTTSQGVLRNEFNLSEEIFIIGSVGLLTKRKGFHVLIDALDSLNKDKKLHNTQCFIFGEGEERKNLEHQIKQYKLQDKVFLPGFRSDVTQYMTDFDTFVISSTNNEDFPYVTLEAMVLNKPIIGTNVAGIPEQVFVNKNGIIIEPHSVDSLKDAIEKFQNREIISKYGLCSHKIYNTNFSYSIIMNKYMSLINR
jgi:glycosyltransferase involved in cell wall biosynthesis